MAARELEFLIAALKGYLDEFEEAAFDKSQKALEDFLADAQAESKSTEVQGGSMRPMVQADVHRLLTIEHAAQIKEEINKRKAVAS